jgi:3'-phosphoadenosine 5'-phosphosulfate sulfotransferase (PAPS reductase)/FAD synthetase
MSQRIVSWFSAGITSTVATLKAIEKFGLENVDIIFFETGNHHPDNERYIADCEKLFGKKITTYQNEKYADIYEVFRDRRFINSPYGAPCTKFLKKRMRQVWEKDHDWKHQVFGFEFQGREMKRAERFSKNYPHTKAIFPLIEDEMTKEDCINLIQSHGIVLPQMYLLGYSNNNCIGCVKGNMGYWNKIRQDFPEVFEKMAALERELDAKCMKERFLDELEEGRGYTPKAYVESCGIFCGDLEWL